MFGFEEARGFLEKNLLLVILLVVALIIIFAFNFAMRIVKGRMLQRAKTKQQISHIKIFARIINVLFVLILILVIIFSYMGDWTGFGIFAGLFTAALGFALQRPITGIVAWLMIVIKRPFNIGDRVSIGGVKGEVYDISLTHVYIDEIGGTTQSEDLSGRNIMVPNYLLFEQNIINYTMVDDFVLGEVAVDITYESNLEKAKKIVLEAGKKFSQEFLEKKEPYIRVSMESSSIKLKYRFFAPAKKVNELISGINEEILRRVKKEKKVDIAYPHTAFVMKKK
jgi:small-conductance mechanosensitive channel